MGLLGNEMGPWTNNEFTGPPIILGTDGKVFGTSRRAARTLEICRESTIAGTPLLIVVECTHRSSIFCLLKLKFCSLTFPLNSSVGLYDNSNLSTFLLVLQYIIYIVQVILVIYLIITRLHNNGLDKMEFARSI